jgi:predicted metal-dependent phosphoesterase TrpH
VTPLVDLHLHTTASDGRCTPREVVDRAAAAQVSVLAVTDHDTVGASAEVGRHAQAHGIETIAGIEITAVEDGRDVHLLGYFLDVADGELGAFLASQRGIRVGRLVQIAERLTELGMPVELPDLTAAAGDLSRTVGRPLVADLMIAAGYVADRREAFDRWLGADCPAFVPRSGASPERVIEIVHGARGLVSLAHPGRTRVSDARIGALARAGLDAIEVYHSDHDAAAVEYYASLAHKLALLQSGGSDFHGDPTHGVTPGGTSLPPDEWSRLCAAGQQRSR